jgi:glucose dehydrogenase
MRKDGGREAACRPPRRFDRLLDVHAEVDHFQALDARTGALLWKTNLGGPINSGPMTYRVGNRQYVSVIAGLSLFTFGVDD